MGWVLVTGGAKRLGAEICLKLAAEGHSVVIHYNQSRQEAVELANKCKGAEIIQGDFSTMHSFQTFVQNYLTRFPATSGLVNNVGIYLVKSALNTAFNEWENLLHINLTVPFLLCKELAPAIQQNQGSIVNIGKVGIFSGSVYSPIYNLTKASLLQLTKSLAREMAPFSVNVNMVSPGHLENSIDLPPLDTLPMKRAGKLSEAANVVAFLMQKENRYVTGQNIEVAGGLHV